MHVQIGTDSSYKEPEQSWQWSHRPGETVFVQGPSGRKDLSRDISLGLESEDTPSFTYMMCLKPVSLPKSNYLFSRGSYLSSVVRTHLSCLFLYQKHIYQNNFRNHMTEHLERHYQNSRACWHEKGPESPNMITVLQS